MNSERALLRFRQEQIKRQITEALDLLQGSVHPTANRRGHQLTRKVEGKTATRYIAKELVPQVRAMTANHLKVRQLLGRLSEVNWRLLQLGPED